ncbi:hypothetical protein LXL04_031682 [Taraxacum kok-saghyz]
MTRVLLCLKRALRIANAAQQVANVARGSSGSVTIFVEILNKLYLKGHCYLCTCIILRKGNPQIISGAIQGLIELIKTDMQSDRATPDQNSDAFL